MKNSTKIIIAVLVILVIAAGVHYMYRSGSAAPVTDSSQSMATTTVSETVSAPVNSELATRTGWKRYTDPEYGFTFQYPSEWVLETAFMKTGSTTLRIVSVASDASRKLPIPERQEIVSIKVAPAKTTTVGGAVEYSSARGGFVSMADAMNCVSPAYKLGAAAAATKLPVFQLMRAHTGDGTRTEDAVLTNKNTLVQISNVSSYPGNADIAGVLSSFSLTGDTAAVVPACKPAATAVRPENQNLIIQVTSPVNGALWDSNTAHTVTWRTGSSPLKGNVGIYLVNRVNRAECLMATAAAQAQSLVLNVTAGQTCVQGGGLTLASGDYDFYIRYPQNLINPFATSTGAFYGDSANRPIHINLSDAQ